MPPSAGTATRLRRPRGCSTSSTRPMRPPKRASPSRLFRATASPPPSAIVCNAPPLRASIPAMLATRRTILAGASAAVVGFAGLKLLGSGSAAEARPDIEGYGPLVPDPARLLDLPRGFSYRVTSRTGEPMSDGLLTPGAFDGMAAFRVRGNRHQLALVRNHEIWPNDVAGGA